MLAHCIQSFRTALQGLHKVMNQIDTDRNELYHVLVYSGNFMSFTIKVPSILDS